MTGRTDWLYVVVVLRSIAEMMVVLVTPLTALPPMSAIGAGQRVRMWAAPSSYLHVDPTARLDAVTVSRSIRFKPHAIRW